MQRTWTIQCVKCVKIMIIGLPRFTYFVHFLNWKYVVQHRLEVSEYK